MAEMTMINGVASVPLILLLILTVTCITALVLSMRQNKFRLNGVWQILVIYLELLMFWLS